MRENKFRKWIRTEIETEAEALEKKAEENTELSSLHMPEDSFADLMSRIEAEKKIRRRTLVAVALAAVLLAALGLGASGERLFAPTVESEIADGEYNVRVINGEDVQYFDWTEEEAYEEIEERLGILALRLGYKPKGMELKEVHISEDMGEAQMVFVDENAILRIYENKQSGNSTFNTHFDGQVLDEINIFQYDEKINILKIEGDNSSDLFAIQLEKGNAYYYVISNLDMDGFEEVVQEIFFTSV